MDFYLECYGCAQDHERWEEQPADVRINQPEPRVYRARLLVRGTSYCRDHATNSLAPEFTFIHEDDGGTGTH